MDSIIRWSNGWKGIVKALICYDKITKQVHKLFNLKVDNKLLYNIMT